MAEDRRKPADRIRADVLALIGASPGGVSRNEVIRDVFGRDQSVIATLDDLVREGLVVLDGAYHPPGWRPELEPLDECDRCPSYVVGELCGRPPADCWWALWFSRGRPAPVGDWEAAGRPDGQVWAASGGLFSYDVADGAFWPDADCETANGRDGCGRPDCYDCVPEWQRRGRCGVPTRRGRMCRNRAARCRVHLGSDA